MYATDPEMAKEWSAHTPKGKKLPKYKKKKRKKKTKADYRDIIIATAKILRQADLLDTLKEKQKEDLVGLSILSIFGNPKRMPTIRSQQGSVVSLTTGPSIDLNKYNIWVRDGVVLINHKHANNVGKEVMIDDTSYGNITRIENGLVYTDEEFAIDPLSFRFKSYEGSQIELERL